MSGINTVTQEGHLSREPELGYSKTGMAFVKFGLAVNEGKKDSEGNWYDSPIWLNVVMFGKQAERFKEKFHKGSHVVIQGRLTMDNWTTPEGEKRQSVNIIAERFSSEKGDPRPGGSAGEPAKALVESEDTPY